MLRLDKLEKVYYVGGGNDVTALDEVTINFRKCEFVSILGPSGCGKTTLLNIIGGLDRATGGELYIDEISTKKYKDRDWDNYRNKRIGFIFQSYNLIPHQTILENVELALNIAGIKKEERTRRAKEMLAKVGLENMVHKKPNQMSGGQCQRVAIARALVNDPEIVLADEPTGALDTATSVQVMDILQGIAKEKLVIMVTHNAELAYKYSTRIIKLRDGKVVEDTNPYAYDEKAELEDAALEAEKYSTSKKSKLSTLQAFKLSFKSLLSKSKRTLLTCIAGSIGIIGIGAVLSVSSGVNDYIETMEGEMLNSSPLQISESTYDFTSLLSSLTDSQQQEILEENTEGDYINVDGVLESIIDTVSNFTNAVVENNITEEFLDYVLGIDSSYYQAIATYYGEDLTNNIYTNVTYEGEGGLNTTKMMSLSSSLTVYKDMLANVDDDYADMSNLANYIDFITYDFDQLPNINGDEFVLSQYDVIETTDEDNPLPTSADELVLVLSDDGTIADLMLAQYGYYSQEEFFALVYKTMGLEYDEDLIKTSFSYSELMGKEFIYYPNDVIYTQEREDAYLYTANANDLDKTNGTTLEIKTILKKKEDVTYGCLDEGIYYSSMLTEKFLSDSAESEVVKYAEEEDDQTIYSMSTTTTIIDETIIVNSGLYYYYEFYIDGVAYTDRIGLVGTSQTLNSFTFSTISLRELGGESLPSTISIYPKDFSTKDRILTYLDAWNEEGDITVGDTTLTYEERDSITVTDNLSLIFSLVENVTSVITYALVAFTALSLVVSTVMIAIITYVSVIERIKEIGVIRSLGGRKKDVKNLFMAETCMIGLTSGVIGVAITYGISALINAIVGGLSGISTIASLPLLYAGILILVSVLLTLISGLAPAALASRKDPAVALRTE